MSERPKSVSGEIIQKISAEYRNSDLRADNPDIRKALDEAFAERDSQIERLTVRKPTPAGWQRWTANCEVGRG